MKRSPHPKPDTPTKPLLTSRSRKPRKKGPGASPQSKSAKVAALLGRPNGATIAELMKITGWQAHSVRGFLSGALKKRHGITVTGEQDESGVRRYRIGEELR
jgi:hypothetical protein